MNKQIPKQVPGSAALSFGTRVTRYKSQDGKERIVMREEDYQKILKIVGDSETLKRLRSYVREKAALADKSSHEWDPTWTGRNPEACYRSGMWWAFHEVESFIGPWQRTERQRSAQLIG